MGLTHAKSVHLIGIGGIGMSALAKWLKWRGATVSGSDLANSEVIASLSDNIKISIGPQTKDNVPRDVEAVVYSQAVGRANPERIVARQLGIPEFSYAQAIADLAQGYEMIAVAGTHGKTSTAAMVGCVLEAAGLDPTVIIGSLVRSWQGNFRPGQSRYLVLEADEYARSFLNYRPSHIIITNIDRDHLDTYQNEKDIINSFKIFCGRLKKGGSIIINQDDKNSRQLAGMIKQNCIRYSLLAAESNIKWLTNGRGQEIKIKGIGTINLNVPGRHMVSNALAVIQLGSILGIKSDSVIGGLRNYQGAWRRFEKIGELNGATVISDYAHHPTEITATIESANQAFKNKKLLVIFQPHQKRRTRMLKQEFVEALRQISDVIVIDIYDVIGREDTKGVEISSQELVDAINKKNGSARYVENFVKLRKILIREVSKNTAVLFLGAGSIHEMALKMLRK